MYSSQRKTWWLKPLVLLAVIVLLHFTALETNWIEVFYSTHIYTALSFLLRILTGWIPFSFGDVLYGFTIVWLLIKFINFFRNKPTWLKFLFALRNVTVKFLWLYLFFLLMWGLNYYRFGIGYQLHIIPEKYNTDDLKKTTSQLLLDLNKSAKKLDSIHYVYPSNKIIFQQAIAMYNNAETRYKFLNYKQAAVKQMLSGTVGNYSGFLGYYNPFTGEAQVNTNVPTFVIPFTTCHEMAHQVGYASESEASFVGYLVIKNTGQPLFNYSAYFDLFSYANAELFSRDSIAAKQNVKLLDTLVKKDYAVYRKYVNDYRNPIEPLLTKLYGGYLKAHNQPKGIDSYNEVVAWIVAYYKKYGTL